MLPACLSLQTQHRRLGIMTVEAVTRVIPPWPLLPRVHCVYFVVVVVVVVASLRVYLRLCAVECAVRKDLDFRIAQLRRGMRIRKTPGENFQR